MRTILVTIFQAVEAKNILRTDVITTLLRDPEMRIICLVRSVERADYYKKEIPHDRIGYEVFPKEPKGIFERFFSVMKFQLLRTETTALRRKMNFAETKNIFVYAGGVVLSAMLAHRIFLKIFRFFDYRLVGDPGFSPLFLKYRPDTVFLAHIFDDTETALIREARRRGVRTVALINSWDKVTARCAIRLLPDTAIVYNKLVRDEMMRYGDMEEKDIVMCGIPQYDHYRTQKPRSREDFFKTIGVNPQKKLILYAPMGAAFSNSDWEIIDLLDSAIRTDFKESALLVRFQPNDFFDTTEIGKRPHIKFDMPGLRYGKGRGGDWDMTFDDLSHLNDTLAHSSLLISYASSISVDAALFDIPVINVNFEVKPVTLPSKSPTFYYKTEHYKKASKTGGIRLVGSKDELKEWIRKYLNDRTLDREARKRLVAEQCYTTSGDAGACVGRVVLGSR